MRSRAVQFVAGTCKGLFVHLANVRCFPLPLSPTPPPSCSVLCPVPRKPKNAHAPLLLLILLPPVAAVDGATRPPSWSLVMARKQVATPLAVLQQMDVLVHLVPKRGNKGRVFLHSQEQDLVQ